MVVAMPPRAAQTPADAVGKPTVTLMAPSVVGVQVDEGIMVPIGVLQESSR